MGVRKVQACRCLSGSAEIPLHWDMGPDQAQLVQVGLLFPSCPQSQQTTASTDRNPSQQKSCQPSLPTSQNLSALGKWAACLPEPPT